MTSPPPQGEPLRQDVSAERDAYVAQTQIVNVHRHEATANADQVRLRVYVSWTSADLRDHREQVRRALRRLGAEEFPTPPDTRSVEDRLEELRNCDLYLGLYAWRYGPVPEGHEHSILELEYRAACAAGIPRLVFSLSDEEPWPRAAMDQGAAGARIDALREELRASGTCEYFTTPADLGLLVAEAVEFRLRRTSAPSSLGDRAGTGPAAWRAYRQRLISAYGRLDLEALTPPEREEYLQLWLKEVFVEPNVRADAPPVELPKELVRKLQEARELSPLDVPRGLEREDLEQARKVYRTRPTRAAFDMVTSASERLCVLLGDPGAGKSTIARYLALALAEERTTGRLADLDAYLPVLIELRDYAFARPQCENFNDYLAYRHRSDGLGLPDGALDSYLDEGGQALVIFDGLDELFDPKEREAVARQIAWFSTTHPTARILVTSRIVGYRKRILEEAGFGHHTLQDLSREQVEEFLTAWYGLALHDRPTMATQRRERLTKAIEESPPIKELAGNPLLLTILAIIGKHRELPRERWKVYDHAASVLVEHWDVNKHLMNARVDADVIREDDKKDLLRRLAYRMQLGTEGLAGNHIWLANLVAEIVDYLRHRYQYDVVRATSIAHAMVEQFRERNFVLARYGPQIYGFVHRALLEFFCAGEIVARFEKTRVLTEEQLAREVFDGHWEDPAWREVLRLIAGMVDATVTDRLLTRLIETAEPVRTTALDQPPLGAVALAAQCLAEVRNIGGIEHSAHLILEAIIDLLRRPDRSFADDREDVLESAILPAVATVGPAWPGRRLYLAWFEEHARRFVTWRACRFAPRLLAALYSDSSSVKDLLADIAQHDALPAQRRASLLGVVETWTDLPGTRDLVGRLLRDNSEIVRQAAIEQLAAHWATHPETLPALHNALLDPASEVRQAAIEQLAAHWATHPETLPALHNALLDPDWTVRRAAAQVLDAPWAHTPDTFTVIRQAVADVDEDVRQAAVRTLAGRWADHPDAYAITRQAVHDPHHQVCVAAIEQLATRWPDHSETLSVLRSSARDPNGQVRCAALIASTRCPGGPADALPLLVDRLSDSLDEGVREAAVEEAARHWPESPMVFQAILRATMDPDQGVRAAAYKALTSSWPGHAELKAACLRGLQDWDDQVRRSALEALAQFWAGRPELLPLLVTCSRDADWNVRRIALETLAARWAAHPQVRTAIGRATRDQAGIVRQTALEILAIEGDDLRLAFTALNDPHQGTRHSARNMLANQWRASWHSAADVKKALRSPLGPMRRTALLAAVALPGTEPWTDAAVDDALRDSDPDVRLAAVQVLLTRRVDHPDALGKVLDATRDPGAEVRGVGLEALAVGWRTHQETRAALHRAAHDLDADVALPTLEALARWVPGEPEVFAALRENCRHFSFTVRKLSLHLLTTRWADRPEALATILDCSLDSDSGTRDQCLEAASLRWPEHAEVVERVRRALLDPDHTVRHGARQLLIARREGHPETAQLLDRDLWDLDISDRLDAATALTFLDDQDPSPVLEDVGSAIQATTHADSRVRLAGLTRLLLTWPARRETRRAVRIAFHDAEWRVRSVALAALLHRWPDDAYATFLAGLRAPAGTVRQLALWGIAVTRPDDPRTREALTAALGDRAYFVRGSVVRHIAALWPDTDPDAAKAMLSHLVDDQDNRVRTAALNWLTVIFPDDSDTLPILARLTRGSWDRVRQTALEALLILHPDHPLTTAALLRACRDPGADEIQRLAREALTRRAAGRTRDLAQVIDDVRHGHWADRVDAMHELVARWHDAPETFVTLRYASADEARQVRLDAVWRLASLWPRHPAVRPLLLRMAVDDDYAYVRRVAIQLLTDGPDDDPEVYRVIAAATADPYWANATTALERLATRWPHRTETLRLLRNAAKGSDWYDRYIALPLLHRLVRRESESAWPVDCHPAEIVQDITWTMLTSGPGDLPLTPAELLPLWHDDANSRSRSAMILAPLRGDHQDDHAALVAAARDQDHAIHLPALRALATWWPDHPETMAALTWAAQHGGCQGARGFALSTLLDGRLDRDEGEQFARLALGHPAPEIRLLALEALQAGGRLDAETLAAFLTDDDPDIVRFAIEVFAVQDPADHGLWEQLRRAADSCPVPWPKDWLEWRLEEQAADP